MCTAPHLLPLGPMVGSAAPSVLAGLRADPQAWVHRCSRTTQATPGVGWGRKPHEAGASAERHAAPDGEQSLAPRPGHVASPGAGWAGGPPRCPSKQAVEAASFWADRPAGCMHALLPHALQCADGPASRVPPALRSSTLQCADGPASPVPPPTSQELSRVPWCPPDRGNRLGTAGTRVRTLSRLKPKLHALGTHPRGDPDPGLEEKAGVGPVSATATPAPSLGAPPSKRRRRGVGGAPQSSWFIDQRQPSIC